MKGAHHVYLIGDYAINRSGPTGSANSRPALNISSKKVLNMSDMDRIRKKGEIALTGGPAFFVPAGFNLKGNTMSKKYEIPESLYGKDLTDESHTAVLRAADKHGKQLSKAENDLATARDLAETLQSYLSETHIDECFTACSIVDLIEKRINKARDLLSSHSRRHTNLFTAYFDLKGGAS